MKAVIPVAGLGTRLLPATKSMPKEMLPVVDKPVIQYVVEEAVASGFDDILFVTGRGKRTIEDHFDHSVDLERHLSRVGKEADREKMRALSDLANIHYVRQPEPLGLGDAVLRAEKFVGDEPFAVLLGDDIVIDGTPPLVRLLETYKRTEQSAISVMRVPASEVARYGIIRPGPAQKPSDEHVVLDFIEKPAPDAAPSDLASIGRYFLVPEVFKHLRATRPGHGGEIQLTDGLAALCRGPGLRACEFTGLRLDTGNALGLLEANITMALRRNDVAEPLMRFLRDVLAKQPRNQLPPP